MKPLALSLGLLFAVPVFAADIEWVQLPADSALQGRWAPSTEQAKSAMTGVRAFVEQQAAKEQKTLFKRQFAYILEHWDSYSCQVIGDVFIGKKTIVLNFFPRVEREEPSFDWKKNEMSVKGGGVAYFRVRYEVETQAFAEVWINSPM